MNIVSEQFGLLAGFGSRRVVEVVPTKRASKTVVVNVGPRKGAEFDPVWNERIKAAVARVFVAAPEGIEPPLYPANTTACVI